MGASTLNLRQARMEFKTTTDTKNLLSQAAALDGVDLTSFVIGNAIEKARRVLIEHDLITLNQKSQLALVSLLHKQPQPTRAMKNLMALPDLLARKPTKVANSDMVKKAKRDH
jgi:uncharacterized protein (DUF1778 family)